jgi:hypothetical protein
MGATVETTAVIATIKETARGSGVMLSYRKVLKYWFSTAQASCPASPNKSRLIHTLRSNRDFDAVDDESDNSASRSSEFLKVYLIYQKSKRVS